MTLEYHVHACVRLDAGCGTIWHNIHQYMMTLDNQLPEQVPYSNWMELATVGRSWILNASSSTKALQLSHSCFTSAKEGGAWPPPTSFTMPDTARYDFAGQLNQDCSLPAHLCKNDWLLHVSVRVLGSTGLNDFAGLASGIKSLQNSPATLKMWCNLEEESQRHYPDKILIDHSFVV